MKKQAQLWLGTLVVLLVILSTVLAGCAPAAAIANPAPAASAPVVPAPVSAPSANNGPNEGVKVHGYWTIDVTNPDGTLAEHREFENSLTAYGATALAQVMGRKYSVGEWFVLVDNTVPGSNAFQAPPNYNPTNDPNLLVPCAASIMEVQIDDELSDFATLTIDVPATGANANKLVLKGTAVAQRDGSINRVRTGSNLLTPNQIPHPAYGGFGIFSGTELSSPVNLTNGQQVAVTVVISFS
jgi:hypothetical protein